MRFDLNHSELERVAETDDREILRPVFQGHLDLPSADERLLCQQK